MGKMRIKTCFQADIVYHMLAHMDVQGNPSNLFSPSYIHKISEAKTSYAPCLEVAMESLREYYNRHFERLCVVNFLPYYTEGVDGLIVALKNYPTFTLEDKKRFVDPFVTLLTREREQFYEVYWRESLASNARNMEEFEKYLCKHLAPLGLLFHNSNLRPNVFISLSMTTFGRGFGMEGFLSASVPLPMGPVEYEDAFFQVVHEFTHQLTDSLLESAITMDDGSHALSESLAIVGDYYLFQRLSLEKTKDYLEWVSRADQNNEKPVASLSDAFPLSEKLDLSLRDLVDQLCRLS